ncbi:hypothetical protein STEG23_034964 [Scotinomys teguina]
MSRFCLSYWDKPRRIPEQASKQKQRVRFYSWFPESWRKMQPNSVTYYSISFKHSEGFRLQEIIHRENVTMNIIVPPQKTNTSCCKTTDPDMTLCGSSGWDIAMTPVAAQATQIRVVDINSDPGFCRAMDPDIALSSSPSLDDTMAPGGSTGNSD